MLKKFASLFFLAATVAAAGVVASSPVAAQTPDGGAVFTRECSSCHTGAPDTRAPSPDVLRRRSPEAILSALTAGGMRPQGGRLTGAERRAVAEYLTGRVLGGDVTGASIGRCTHRAAAGRRTGRAGLERLVADGTNTRFQTGAAGRAHGRTGAEAQAEMGVRLSRRDLGVVAADRRRRTPVRRQPERHRLLARREERLHHLDVHGEERRARTAPIFGAARRRSGYAVLLRRHRRQRRTRSTRPPARVLWTTKVDEHPFARITGSPTLDRRPSLRAGFVARGNGRQPAGLRVLHVPRQRRRARQRRPARSRWKTYMVPRGQAGRARTPPARRCWGRPASASGRRRRWTRKRDVIYVATGNTLQRTAASRPAMRSSRSTRRPARSSGRSSSRPATSSAAAPAAVNCLEKAGPDFDFGTPPMLVTRTDGSDIIVLGQKSGMAYAVDPDKQGELLWQYRAGEGSIWGGIQWGMSTDGEQRLLPGVRHPQRRSPAGCTP